MRIRVLLAFLAVCALALPVQGEEKRIEVDLKGRPFLGSADAPVTIVEFLDFQ